MELQGYKTFASKNVFEFAPTITAIVGPNGSGKSNIADSIRWVLGEQSYHLLRGKKTEDMIFSGSETRSRAGMASASIVFDNEEGWLPIDFTEVTVGRRAYRDSVNEYFLNGQKVRLRDVSELLAECGLSQRTYTIVGQGLVDSALSLNPEERRKLFEEAAGISLYRNRKREAQRRLDATKRNLERVQDILAELRPRLRSLERQAKKAQDFEQVKEDLNSVLRIWYGYHWYQLQDQVAITIASADRVRSARDGLQSKQLKAEEELLATRSKITSLRISVQEKSQQILELNSAREVANRKFSIAVERTRWLADQFTSLELEISAAQEKRSILDLRLQKARREASKKKQDLVQAENSIRLIKRPDDQNSVPSAATSHEIRAQIDAHIQDEARSIVQNEQRLLRRKTIEQEVEHLLEVRDENAQRIAAINAENEAVKKSYARLSQSLLESEKRALGFEEQLERTLSSRAELATRLLNLKAKNAELIARLDIAQANQRGSNATLDLLMEKSFGIIGQLVDNMQIAADYVRPIRAALGTHHNTVAFQSLDEMSRAMQPFEGDPKPGRTTLFAIDGVRVPPLIDASRFPESIGNAADFVQVSPEFQAIINSILGRFLIVETSKEAKRIARDLPSDARVVTMDGKIYYPAGHVVLGGLTNEKDKAAVASQLTQDHEDLEIRIGASQKEQAKVENTEQELRGSIKAVNAQLRSLQGNIQENRMLRDQLDLRQKAAEESSEDTEIMIQQLKGESTKIDQLLVSQADREEKYYSFRADLDLQLQRVMLDEGDDSSAVVLVRAQTTLDVSQQVVKSLESRVSELADELSILDADDRSRNQRVSDRKAERKATQSSSEEAQKELAQFETAIRELRAQIDPEQTSLEDLETQRTLIERDELKMRVGLRDLEEEHSQAQIVLARRQEELVSLQRRIEDDFGLVAFDFEEGVVGQDPLPFEGLVEHLPRVDEIPDATKMQVNRLRNQLRRLGAVNPGSRLEYEEVRDRVDFLTTQMDDTHRAEAQIQDVIAELDLLMEREFRKTFDAVAVEFHDVFKHLFGGGSARLILTNADDMTQTGIDIEARLPGRREQSLAMLSGGERSLTACSLIFALMKVSPTPFCVLDEVDAMLDDANVVRFSEVLQDLSKKTQFVVITHNRQTVQAAEIVYGITMGRDLASQVISLKLDEAEKVIAG